MSSGGKAGLAPRKHAGLGWKPDLPDIRDHKYAATARKRLPAAVDLRKTGHLPEVWDQGQIGSCTGHGVGALMSYIVHRETGQRFQPSRLFIYYCEREVEGTVDSDNGAAIRDGIKVVHQLGVPDESLWPYSDDAQRFKNKPDQAAYDAAKLEMALTYQRVDRTEIKKALAADQPVVFGFSVYDSFQTREVAKTGVVPMPKSTEALEGGHCVLIVGYDNAKKAYLCRNSWGPTWGEQGHFWLPYEFITTAALSSDFWTVLSSGKAA